MNEPKYLTEEEIRDCKRQLILKTVTQFGLNALRIAVTGLLTSHVSKEAAEGFFHGFSGWLIFMVSFIILALFSFIMKKIRLKLCGNTPDDEIYPERKNAIINLIPYLVLKIIKN